MQAFPPPFISSPRSPDPPKKIRPAEETSQKSAAIAKLSDQKSKVSRTMRTTFKATTLQFTQFINNMYNLTESAINFKERSLDKHT